MALDCHQSPELAFLLAVCPALRPLWRVLGGFSQPREAKAGRFGFCYLPVYVEVLSSSETNLWPLLIKRYLCAGALPSTCHYPVLAPEQPVTCALRPLTFTRGN